VGKYGCIICNKNVDAPEKISRVWTESCSGRRPVGSFVSWKMNFGVPLETSNFFIRRSLIHGALRVRY